MKGRDVLCVDQCTTSGQDGAVQMLAYARFPKTANSSQVAKTGSDRFSGTVL